MKKITSLLLALTLALALLTGCGNSAQDAAQATATPDAAVSEDAQTPEETPAAAEEDSQEASDSQDAQNIQVTFNVTDAEGNTTPFTLDAQEGESLGDALLAAGLISQEEHDAGFVTVVNGQEANWDDGQAWWSLVDGEGQMTSVGISDITLHNGDVYGFVYTVG